MKRIKVFIQYNILTITRHNFLENELGYGSSFAFAHLQKKICKGSFDLQVVGYKVLLIEPGQKKKGI